MLDERIMELEALLSPQFLKEKKKRKYHLNRIMPQMAKIDRVTFEKVIVRLRLAAVVTEYNWRVRKNLFDLDELEDDELSLHRTDAEQLEQDVFVKAIKEIQDMLGLDMSMMNDSRYYDSLYPVNNPYEALYEIFIEFGN